MRNRNNISAIIFLISLFLSQSLFAEVSPLQQNFLVLSDIHFDPFIGCFKVKTRPCPLLIKLRNAPVTEWRQLLLADDQRTSGVTQDTNYPLLASALSAASTTANAQHAQFVLLLGDYLSHDFRRYYKKYAKDKSFSGYQAFVKKTLFFVTSELEKTFPNLDVYTIIGNNDSFRRDYYTDLYGGFFHETGTAWSRLIKNTNNKKTMQAEFSQAGYYAVNLSKNMRLIALNSVMFSKKAQGDHVADAANAELNWLHHELSEAVTNHQQVIIAMHIPMSLDIYAINFHLFTLMELWQPRYIEKFNTELQMAAPNIVGIFTGHFHADWYHQLKFKNATVAMTGTPSISPMFGNNPGFKIYRYEVTPAKLVAFATYYLPIGSLPVFGGPYHFNVINYLSCHDCPILQTEGNQSDLLVKSLATMIFGESSLNEVVKHWSPYYWCVIGNQSVEGQSLC